MAFKMKGHTLPGINQRMDGKIVDGRPESAAFQKTKSKTDKKIINSLKSELMAMKDPMESNRGKNIVKKLRALGADPEDFM